MRQQTDEILSFSSLVRAFWIWLLHHLVFIEFLLRLLIVLQI